VSQRLLGKVLAAVLGVGVLGSSAANAAATAPPTVDPLFAVSLLGTSGARTSAALTPAASMAAAQGGYDTASYDNRGDMWPLWVGLGAVAIFIIWDLSKDHGDGGDDVIILPVSP
jgi:hypothetical protein